MFVFKLAALVIVEHCGYFRTRLPLGVGIVFASAYVIAELIDLCR